MREDRLRAGGESMGVQGLLSLLILAGLSGCGERASSGPAYKSYPPLSMGAQEPAKTAPLSGFVYVAQSPMIAPGTLLPEGYRRLTGEDGRITVRIPGTPPQTRTASIVEGAYRVEDLPMGVELEVLASHSGYAARRRQVTIELPAGRRLNFEHDPDGAGTYLLPLQEASN